MQCSLPSGTRRPLCGSFSKRRPNAESLRLSRMAWRSAVASKRGEHIMSIFASFHCRAQAVLDFEAASASARFWSKQGVLNVFW